MYINKKFIYSILIAIISFSAIYYYKLSKIEKYDVSISNTTNCKNLSKKIWLISYASGDQVHYANQKFLSLSALDKCVDFILMYNPKHLDHKFKEENKETLSQKRGRGYWLWKPYIIAKTLNLMEENDILIYSDSSLIFNSSLNDLISKILDEKYIFAFKNRTINSEYTKKELLEYMNMDNEETKKSNQLNADFLILRNSPVTRKFVSKWLEIGSISNLINDELLLTNQYQDFIDHRHDQSILSLLWLQNKEIFFVLQSKKASKYFKNHRRRSLNEGSLINK